MAASTLPCPHCGAILRPTQSVSAGQKVRCPSCQEIFVSGADEPEAAPVSQPRRERVPSERAVDRQKRRRDADDVRRSRARREDDEDEDFRPRRRRSSQRTRGNSGLVLGLVIGGAAVLLVAGGVMAVHLYLSHHARTPGQVTDPNTDEGRAQLIEDLSSSDFFTRQQALDELAQVARLPPDRAPVARALERLVYDKNPFISEGAMKALVVWGDEDSVPVLLGALNAENPFTQEAAMKALGKIKDPRAVKPLAALLKDIRTRHGASAALKFFGPVAEKEVATYLQSTEPFLRQEACEILAEIGTERSIPALEAIVHDADEQVNFFAVRPARSALAAIRARARKT